MNWQCLNCFRIDVGPFSWAKHRMLYCVSCHAKVEHRNLDFIKCRRVDKT